MGTSSVVGNAATTMPVRSLPAVQCTSAGNASDCASVASTAAIAFAPRSAMNR